MAKGTCDHCSQPAFIPTRQAHMSDAEIELLAEAVEHALAAHGGEA